MIKKNTKAKFEQLIRKYNEYIKTANIEDMSEETIRVWINEMLTIFGWNPMDTNEILQEKILPKKYITRLKSIKSSHLRPDYILLNGKNIKSFMDAKDVKVNIANNKEVAFQIRSYGWSAEVPYAFVTNFKEFAIYDCMFMPNPEQEANLGMQYFTIDNYLDNFDVIYDHLFKSNILCGKLDELYNKTLIEGSRLLNESFTDILSEFRLKLAKDILSNNKNFIDNDNIRLNYYVQLIMDRIIFIRVCESRGIEKEYKLMDFLKEGFWESFKKSCYIDFHEHYNGAMFTKDIKFNEITIGDTVFENFINKLYYPSPFKFDVIPVKVIANIYENFLAKQLDITDKGVIETFKAEYIKTQGVISTPKYLVESICKMTIQLNDINSIKNLLSLKILDPACGSGTFLVTCFELLENKLVTLYTENRVEAEYLKWFVSENSSVYLTVDAKREVMKNCLHGIDCDDSAIEVTKMSLALKVIDNNDQLLLRKLGVFGRKILREVHNNIKLGNTLIKPDIILDEEGFLKISPLDIEGNGFKEIFGSKGGFDYVIGNPPYVETKHYKNAFPDMHTYLSTKYSTFAGKADLSILFIERCMQLLNPSGKLGFIVQKRFFKTDYGIKIRKLISDNKYLSRLIDFKTSKLFYGRLTYVAIMILDKKGSDSVNYEYLENEPLEIQYLLENEEIHRTSTSIQKIYIPSQYISKKTWCFESYSLLTIIDALINKFGTFGEYPKLQIKDGIQALWKKAYHFTGATIKDNVLTGKNGWGEVVRIETAMVKGVIYNESFYCFNELEPNAYCLFPYEGDKLKTPIPISIIKDKYPLAYNYLKTKENDIKNTVHYCNKDELWHIFTREHNHDTYYDNKIIIPMTALDTISTYVESQGLYMDNSNVWFIKIDGADTKTMKAISAIINSTAFSVFAKAGANPQSNNYYKFNKQFLMPVPFPTKKLLQNKQVINELANLYVLIKKDQDGYINTTDSRKPLFRDKLNDNWAKLDEIIYNLYELESDELKLVKTIGRTVDRVNLLD